MELNQLTALMQNVREDAERHGGNVEYQLDEHQVSMKVQADLDDIGQMEYEVNNLPKMVQEVIDDADDPQDDKSLVDAFWRVMGDNYRTDI